MILLLSGLILFFGTMAIIKRSDLIEKTSFEQDCASVLESEIYLAVGETYILSDDIWNSDDNDVAFVADGKITAFESGTATVSNGCSSYLVHVSDLYTIPVIAEKEYLPCGRYTAQENMYLDEAPKYEITSAGYRTRAGAVAAARFLLLRFPYKLVYFYENGRMSTDGDRVDGEGRYYHEGLYLNEYKEAEITEAYYGPKIWGCPLYGVSRNIDTENGLDCSGFISWVLFNAGFECGDLGAGPVEGTYDLSDLGEKVNIRSLNMNEVMVGDLVGLDGHIGMIIGMDEENVYIGEAYWVKDLQVRIYSYQDFLNSSEWEYAVLMDDYYADQGDLTEMW